MRAPSGIRAPGAAALGEFIKSQRRLARLSQRELARLAGFSDAYLSQIERGLHRPSLRIVRDLATALNVPADTLLSRMGLLAEDGADVDGATALAIAGDPQLTDEQKRSLMDVYKAFLAANEAAKPAE